MSSFLKNLPLILISVAVVYVPLFFLLHIGSLDEARTLAEDGSRRSGMAGLYGLVAQSLLAAVVCYGVVQSISGKSATFGESLSKGLTRALPVLGVSLLVGLVVGVGFVLLFVPGMILMCMLFVAVPAAVLEAPVVMGALKRSRELTAGSKRQIFSLLFSLGVLVLLIGFVLQATGFGGEVTAAWQVGKSETQVLSRLNLQTGVGVLVNGLSSAFSAVAATVVYYMLRQNKEGARAEDLASVFR